MKKKASKKDLIFLDPLSPCLAISTDQPALMIPGTILPGCWEGGAEEYFRFRVKGILCDEVFCQAQGCNSIKSWTLCLAMYYRTLFTLSTRQSFSKSLKDFLIMSFMQSNLYWSWPYFCLCWNLFWNQISSNSDTGFKMVRGRTIKLCNSNKHKLGNKERFC